MFKIIKSITDIVKLCISLSKKYWYIFDPLLSGFMSAIASFYGWAVWYFGKPLVIWFSFLLGLLIIALLRLVYCLINCAYSNWKIQKEIDKIEKESKAKMAENEHNSQLRRQEEKERATNEMLKNGNEHGIIMQALTTLNKPNQDIVKCKNELGIVKTYYPLKTGLPIETQNQITKFLAHTELQVERISSDTKLTDIQYERLDDILEGYLKRRDEGVKSLLRKVANIITNDKSPTNISKDAINFKKAV